MKLELPDDHPIAKAIREATRWKSTVRLQLSLNALQDDGSVARILAFDIDQWSKTRKVEERFECELTDVEVRNAEIEAMMTWPTMDDQP